MVSKPGFKIRLLLIVLFLPALLYGEATGLKTNTDSDIKAALILNFARYISPAIRKSADTIYIGSYGEDRAMVQSLQKIEFQKARGKVVKLVHVGKLSDFQQLDALYVFRENNYDVWRIFKSIRQQPIILITDGYADKREIMVNFIETEDNKIQFEINSKNLQEAGLEISPKLLLFGGTELDIMELYNVTEKSLNAEKEKSDYYEKQLESKKTEIRKLNNELSTFYVRIDSLNNIILFQINNIRKQKSNLDSMKKEVGTLSEVANKSIRIIDSTNQSINVKNKLIADLDFQLVQKQKMLENTALRYNKLQDETHENEIILEQQSMKIINQKIAIIVFLAFLLLLIIGLGYVYKSYKQKQIQNQELAKRNEKINNQKAQIEKQAESLQQAINEMEIQKNRAEKTLEKLKNTQSQLVVAEKMASLGLLTAGIAHEINNPISYISSSIEGLRYILSDIKLLLNEFEKLSVNQNQEHIERLKKEFDYDELIKGFDELTSNIKLGVDRTKEIVNSLRMFSRADEESYEVNINEIIDSVLLLIGKQYNDRITILKNFGNIPEIKCNKGKIFQVFMNIIVNAIQAINNNGIIKISTEIGNQNDENQVKISISDDGTGMSNEVLDKIFEPFFTTKESGRGTGLGLSITYSIVNKLGGRIEISSKLNQGTNVLIYFPMNKA